MIRLVFLAVLAAASLAAQESGAGFESYSTRCVLCHAGDGSGTDRGPAIVGFIRANSSEEIEAFVRRGVPQRGMPAFDLDPDEMDALVAHVKTFDRANETIDGGDDGTRVGELPLVGGGVVRGEILNLSGFDAHVRADDGKIRRLVREGDVFRDAPLDPHVDWEHYHGRYDGNRHSPLDQIRRKNVGRLRTEWFFPMPGHRMIEGTPLVLDGLMYVTAVNRVSALDAATGRDLWTWSMPRTEGLMGDARLGLNRGAAVRGDRLFTVTDHAHLVALDRWTGELLWDSEMADYRDHYGAIAAPLVVGDLVVAGISGGDTGLRGFLDAYHAETGERAWRFWTIPAPDDPEAKTWGDPPDPEILARGCGATWLTGSYDSELDLLYWAVGNPCPDLNADRRPGDNLYTNSVLALKPATGELEWHFQFTPGDTHDWDAQEPFVLVDEQFRGESRKLLLQANRNGLFYVLDRTDGEFLMAEPFAKQTWADGMDASGRPIVRPNTDPTEEGTAVCPAIRGATNWMSSSYSGQTGLFYLLVHEACNVYSKIDRPWERGRGFLGGTFALTEDSLNKKFIRAIDIQTGEVAWSYEQTGEASTYSGVLSTDGGLVFFGEDSGAFAALDAETGEPVWHVQLNQDWKASPMTYMVAGKQYVAIASGMGFWAFALGH